jgi:hypothetical protein
MFNITAGETLVRSRIPTERTMQRPEPKYTDIAMGISREMWSAEIQSRKLNTALRILLYVSGILAVTLAALLVMNL